MILLGAEGGTLLWVKGNARLAMQYSILIKSLDSEAGCLGIAVMRIDSEAKLSRFKSGTYYVTLAS